MSTLILECCAASLDPIAAATVELTKGVRHLEISSIQAGSEEQMNYKPINTSLEAAMRLLGDGTKSSVMAEMRNASLSFVQVHRPNFGIDRWPFWYMFAEMEEKYSPGLIEPFKKYDLLFVSLALEDSLLDLEISGPGSSEDFPWDHWRLLCAAVRRPGEDWNQKEGPAATQLHP